ncbi:PAP-associated domain-containing protein [Aphelenchoides bicaudatus]|nr:PAP-associated domain-containing protein [Aphelenchoides bicaudatus]
MPTKSTESTRNKPMTSADPTPSESASHVQQRKTKQTNSKSSKRTKWSPFPVELQTSASSSSLRSSQKPSRNRRRRKNKTSTNSRCRKPAASPSLASTCSSNSIISSSSGLGSLGSSAATTNGTHDTISTPTLPSSGCSSIGDKYDDLVSERDSVIEAEEETESTSETINDDLSVSVGFITENFIQPDLTNPAVQQFYQEQRLIYRQFYERQFSTMTCVPYSATDATYCALTSQFNRCSIQPNRSNRSSKHSVSNRSSFKSDHSGNSSHRKPYRQLAEMKPRVFYNSSNRQDSHQKHDQKDAKSSQQNKEVGVNQVGQTAEPSCSFAEEKDENCLENNKTQSIESLTETKPSGKKGKRDSNEYNRPPNNYKKRQDQQTSQQNDKDKSEADWKKLIGKLDPLSAQIFEFQKSIEQTATSLCEKLYLRDLLYCAIAPHFVGCGLYIVGSTLNGFGSGSSDMDLCLMVTSRELDQRIDAVLVLSTVMTHLKNLPLIENMEIISAKVPILRATFKPPFDKIVVDLNANNAVAIRNTHLLCFYSGFDWRVRPLVCVIKEWAKRRGINSANHSSLTSYSLVLMAIHYLQCGVKVPILPSLQHLYHNRFNAKLDVRNLDISYPLEQIRGWEHGKNPMSLSELLKGFFHYYAHEFDFDNSAISVRLGRVVGRAFVVSQHRNQYHALAQWRCICIEEPFTLSNAAHAVYDERIFEAIKNSFKQASTDLEHDSNLETLLNNLPIQSPTNDLINFPVL